MGMMKDYFFILVYHHLLTDGHAQVHFVCPHIGSSGTSLHTFTSFVGAKLYLNLLNLAYRFGINHMSVSYTHSTSG